ncbi:PREDICTED: kelch-like protein 3 [Acropora digitifera]|uniref:kelch-like protein 3 n=1 Tax=Acropora digitifera TaxID=70779 RepID=UPI00077A62FD|nr:PREDICTED: kelch-like protein 3 [Acropora digitifera]
METASHLMSADPSQHHEELLERINALRTKQRFCDVTVVVKGEEFQAHKLVLAAASPFFLSLLESQMKERTEDVIKIELQEATAPVMEQVLAYVYTGNVSWTTEIVYGLIVTADYLLLPGLKTMGESFLKLHLTIENSVFNYYFAEKYQCGGLKEESCKMINENFRKVMETADFLSLDENQVVNWVSSDDVIVKAEQDIFEGILQWVLHNRSEREENFPKLLQQVRLSSVSHEYLFNELLNEELVKTNLDCVNFVMEYMKLIFNCRGETSIKPARKCLERNENVIFVCGGSKALCYLPSENKWHELMNTTLEHKDHCIIQCRDRVYVFSSQGMVGDKQSHVVEYYMPSTNSWGTIQTKFEYDNEEFVALFVLDDNKGLWIITNNESDHDSYICEYNPDKNIWVGSYRELGRWGACFVTDGHCIFIIGGTFTENEKITAKTEVQKIIPCDETEDGKLEFKEVAPMNEARHDAFGAAMNGKIYVAGGKQRDENLLSERVLASCEVYDPSTDEWQVMPSLNVPRDSASMVCFKGALYVVGGLKSSNCGALSVEMFDSVADQWQEKSNIPVKGKKETICFNACFATVHKNCLDV